MKEANMVTPGLVQLIQTHSEELADSLLQKVRHSPVLSDYSKVPPHELKQRIHEVYRNLEDWLLMKTKQDITRRYTEIGARRAVQGIPLCQLIWAILLVKEHLWEFLNREARTDQAVELHGELYLLQLVEQFFDRAVYYAAIGYERARLARAG
jgi:hypothetical protein